MEQPQQSSGRQWVEVGHTWELDEGRGRRVVVEGQELALYHRRGAFHAVSDACPHRGASLGDEGYLDEHGHLVCAWHHWSFDIESGDIRGPHDGCLQVFPVRVEGDRLLIGLPPSE